MSDTNRIASQEVSAAEREVLEAPYGRKKDGLPRKPGGFAKGGANYKPPRSTSGDRNGPGWGGPAKGKGKDLSDVSTHTAYRGPERELRIADKEAAAERLFGVVHEIAIDPEQPPGARVQAAVAGMNRVWGAPEQRSTVSGTIETRNLTLNADLMTPEQRDELRAALMRARERLIEQSDDQT